MSIDFQHPANAGILARIGKTAKNVTLPNCAPEDYPDLYGLGTHPDLIVRLWDELTTSLPEQCAWIINKRPVLVHPTSGIIFGYAEGTHAYTLRLPPTVYEEAIAQGATRVHAYPDQTFDLETVGPEWVFGHWLKEEPGWCLAAYEFAGKAKE